MVFHCLSDYRCNFVEAPVIYLQKCVYDTPLDRLEAVKEIGDGPVSYNVRGILKIIILI